MGYYSITVKPEIDVAALAAGNIGDSEVLFDWKGFDVPNNAAMLQSLHVLVRGKNGADYTPTDMELFYGKSHNGVRPTTFGDDGAAVDTPGWFHNLIGKTYVDASGGANDTSLIYMNAITVGNPNQGIASASQLGFLVPSSNGLILQGEPNTGSSVGYSKLYVTGLAQTSNWNWGASTMTVDGSMSTLSPTLTVADLDATIALAPGDVLRDEDDLYLGVVKSVDSATQVTLVDNLFATSSNDKIVYNTTPITLIFGFHY